jgi:hypothetical protein
VFNGDISGWDVSSVETMEYMFAFSVFDGNISLWNLSSVISIDYMFSDSVFNGDLCPWRLHERVTVRQFFTFLRSPLSLDIFSSGCLDVQLRPAAGGSGGFPFWVFLIFPLLFVLCCLLWCEDSRRREGATGRRFERLLR